MKRFVHVHSSSRFDRSPKSLRDAVEFYKTKGSLITFTEVQRARRERVLERVDDWGSETGSLSNRDDCGIIWDENVWEHLWGRTKIVLPSMFWTKGGKKVDPSACATVVLRHKDTGKKLLVTVFHFPSGVEGKRGLAGLPRRVKAWRVAQKNWKRHWNRVAKRHNVDALLVVSDWNVNIKRAVIRKMLKRLQPGMRSVWGNGPFPKGGTHHKRIIDFSFIRGHIKKKRQPILMRNDNSSDHRPYKEVLKFTKVR